MQARSPDSSPDLPAPEPLSSVKWDDTNPLKAGQRNRRAHREEGKGGQTLKLRRFLGRNWERQALRLVGRGLEGLEDHASQVGMILLLFTSEEAWPRLPRGRAETPTPVCLTSEAAFSNTSTCCFQNRGREGRAGQGVWEAA